METIGCKWVKGGALGPGYMGISTDFDTRPTLKARAFTG